MPLQVLTVVVLPAMSSKKEEIEEKRAAAAASIRPGWTVQALECWMPIKDKPMMKHLRQEAIKRGLTKELRTSQDHVTWLSHNGPNESTAAPGKTMLLRVDSEGMVDPETLTTFKCARKSRTGVRR